MKWLLCLFLLSGAYGNDVARVVKATEASSSNDPKVLIGRYNVVADQIGTALASVFSSSDTISAGTSQNSIYGVYTNNSTTGCTAQANCGTYSEPHTMGVLGKGEDVAGSNVTMYGVEGRVDGRGTASGHKYVGVIGVGAFQGASLAAEVRGVDSLVQATTDGSTPLANSTLTNFYARPIVGGLVKWNFYGSDPSYFGKVRLGTVGQPTQLLELESANNPMSTIYNSTSGVSVQYMAHNDGYATFGSISNHSLTIITNATARVIILGDGSIYLTGLTCPAGQTAPLRVGENGLVSKGTCAP